MKISRELLTGLIAIAAIGLLIFGINFLKGNSFFGGDAIYYAYFPNSGLVNTGSPVTINGVKVGQVMEVKYLPENDSLHSIRVSFSIQEKDIKLPKETIAEIGSLDFFNKGIILHLGNPKNGYYDEGATLEGKTDMDLMAEVKAYADPITQKLQIALNSIDKMVKDVSSFWDTTATGEIEGSLKEIKVAIKRFGNAAVEIEGLVKDEKIKLTQILNNVESLTGNLKKSNEKITGIIGNFEKLSSELVTSDYKQVINNAKITLERVNTLLDAASNGEGTLSKLIHDEQLYNELVNTNKEVQELLNDIEAHPERYIHFSVLGAKTKGVPLTKKEEKKLKQLLDSIP